jgi:hypothetical protein
MKVGPLVEKSDGFHPCSPNLIVGPRLPCGDTGCDRPDHHQQRNPGVDHSHSQHKRCKGVCRTTGCRAKTAMFAPINVTCPAATRKTCTFHIFLDAKASFGDFCNRCQGGGADYFQFLVDEAPPTIGPTDARGLYRFAQNIVGFAGNELRESFPASVVATVTNSTSNNHTVALNVACKSTTAGGCQTTAHASTLRVDVFEP